MRPRMRARSGILDPIVRSHFGSSLKHCSSRSTKMSFQVGVYCYPVEAFVYFRVFPETTVAEVRNSGPNI